MDNSSNVIPNRFQGQRAVITGGASGIGRQVATRLKAEGAQVVVWDVAVADNQDGIEVDVTDATSVDAAAAQVIAELGGIDILVCSAGITGPTATTWEYPLDEWKKVIEVNLYGTLNANRAVVPAMRENGYGRIVNLASVAGKEGNPNASAYSTSKAAVVGLTKSLGKELAGSGVVVNCITPAAVKTEIFDQLPAEFIEFMLKKIPMGRFGTIDEAAAMICWMASSECSFTTGGVFDLSGGRATY